MRMCNFCSQMSVLLEVKYCTTKSVGLVRKIHAVSSIYNERVRLGASSSSKGTLDVDLDSYTENSPVSHDRELYCVKQRHVMLKRIWISLGRLQQQNFQG